MQLVVRSEILLSHVTEREGHHLELRLEEEMLMKKGLPKVWVDDFLPFSRQNTGGKLHQYKYIYIYHISIFSDCSSHLLEEMKQQISVKEFEQ